MAKNLSKSAALEFVRASKKYKIQNAVAMPQLESLRLGEARLMNAAILFIDMRGSTAMSQSCSFEQQLSVLHTYLSAATKLVRESGAIIEKYTGDGIMAIYSVTEGIAPRAAVENAFQTAASLIRTVRQSVNPALREHKCPEIACAAGMDYGEVLIARTGIRGENDLITIGSVANQASKIENETEKWKIGIGEAAHKILFPDKWFERWLDGEKVKGYRYHTESV